MHKDFTSFKTADLVGWDSGISAADPEVLWFLNIFESFEELWILLEHSLSPDLVILHNGLKVVHDCGLTPDERHFIEGAEVHHPPFGWRCWRRRDHLDGIYLFLFLLCIFFDLVAWDNLNLLIAFKG